MLDNQIFNGLDEVEIAIQIGEFHLHVITQNLLVDGEVILWDYLL